MFVTCFELMIDTALMFWRNFMRSLPTRRLALATTIAAGSLALVSCVTATPYQPATGRGSYANGYSDEQIEPNRFRVSFSGNSLTARETVERYLLYRAAQLTLERGFDHFILVDRDTERRTRTYVDRPFGNGPWGYWGPSWRYYRPHYGWRGWSPFWGDPFWGNDIDVRTVDRYEAMAEIILGRGPKPADNLRAFDARAVIDNLGPSIMMPEPR
jgi:hypothetical protein